MDVSNPLTRRSWPGADRTVALFLKGYGWLPPRTGAETGTGPLPIRLFGRPAVVLRGPGAVPFFYDERHALRSGALPGPVLDTLFGRGAVHTLDSAGHRVRKELFLSWLTEPSRVAALADGTVGEFRARLGVPGREAVLLDEAALVLARAVRDWAGLPGYDDGATALLGRDCVAMVDGFATPGPRHLRARRARARQEALLREAVVRAREDGSGGGAGDPPRTPFEAVVAHREADGSLLPPDTAAVELLNIVRPTVAIAWFTTFAAYAMSRRPDVRRRLAEEPEGRDEGPAGLARSFAHEVRRFYPFAPFVGALAARGLVLDGGTRVGRGTPLLLDVFGQNHDPALWEDPYRFVPDRFLGASAHPAGLIPQGGGPPEGHRCPGEDITVVLLARLSRELARLDFAVAGQDTRIPLRRVPTRPRDGLRITVGTRARAGAAGVRS
ncbi:cytochrome P450 [Streptomyces sp. CC208A]|uniref:cytochrome P450 n=1 Tax=Streptomyces sp. CC208A TaxID=3044573 RepID=UPI0024A9A038|nr:cytochrome P450 [Streptomyces sp. CC208A]